MEMDMDSVWQITGKVMGENDVSSNKIWYELDGKGFAHSRRIQPVKQIYNQPRMILPPEGCLGEVTIPFVDATKAPIGIRRLSIGFIMQQPSGC